MSQSKPYIAAEILQYLDGKMNAAEMHAFEKNALSDPWLDEAIEGYRAMKNQQSTEAILARLSEVQPVLVAPSFVSDSARLVRLSWIKRISYAAAGVLFLTAGWWLFNLQKPTDPILAPEVAPATLQENTMEPILSFTDTQKLAEVVQPTSTEASQTKQNKVESKVRQGKNAPKTVSPAPIVDKEVVNPEMAVSDQKEAFPQISGSSKGDVLLNEKLTVSKENLMQAKEMDAGKAMANKSAEVKKSSAKSFQTLPLMADFSEKITLLAPTNPSDAIPAMGWETFKSKLANILPPNTNSTNYQMNWTVLPDGKLQQIKYPELKGDKKSFEALQKLLVETMPWKVKDTTYVQEVLIRW